MARIVFAVVDPFADWEPALLAAGARMYLGDEVRWFSPGGRTVHSLGGLSVNPDGKLEDFDPEAADALVAIGSPLWESAESPDFSSVLQSASGAGIVVAGICGATLALARAGLLDRHAHTSNSPEYLAKHAPSYCGTTRYQDVPQAVIDGRLVTAPGSAPATFAVAVLQLLHPEAAAQLAGFRCLCAREHLASGCCSPTP
jgi:putative intracellular protease/amidase